MDSRMPKEICEGKLFITKVHTAVLQKLTAEEGSIRHPPVHKYLPPCLQKYIFSFLVVPQYQMFFRPSFIYTGNCFL